MTSRAFPLLVILAAITAACSKAASTPPAPADLFAARVALFADNTPESVQQTGVRELSGSRKYAITFAGYHGQRVNALLFEPAAASASNPVPCLLLLHGLGGSKEMLAPVAQVAANMGYASILIDEAGETGPDAIALTTSVPGEPRFPPVADEKQLAARIRGDAIATVVDMRRALDMLDQRPEIDGAKIGVVGYSFGALVACVLGAVDPRIKAVALMSGGGDIPDVLLAEADSGTSLGGAYADLLRGAGAATLHSQIDDVDPINYVAHIAPRPLLMEHGRLDDIIPPQFAEQLYDAAGQPKRIDWYPDSGHVLPPLLVYSALSQFLTVNLPAGRHSGR